MVKLVEGYSLKVTVEEDGSIRLVPKSSVDRALDGTIKFPILTELVNKKVKRNEANYCLRLNHTDQQAVFFRHMAVYFQNRLTSST